MNWNSDSVSPLPHAVTMMLSCTSIKQPKYEWNPYIYIYLYLLPKSRMREKKKVISSAGSTSDCYMLQQFAFSYLAEWELQYQWFHKQALAYLETDPQKTVEDVECILKVHLIIYPGAAQSFLCFRRAEGTLSASFHTLEFTSILQ